MDIREVNQRGWDERVKEGDIWSLPVSTEQLARAREGDWSVLLTSTKPVPREWFGELAGKDLLCLASGGGQQAPIFAAAGARVTVFDASPGQLHTDRRVSEREGLGLRIEQGYMDDLSRFGDESFDLVFHPISNLYAERVLPVWQEVARVLRPGGALLAGFMSPASYLFDPFEEDEGRVVLRFKLPYSDVSSLEPHELERILSENHTVEFSHSLEEQLGGQLAAGLQLTALYEDKEPARPVAEYLPDMIATRAIKPLR
jgi:SAM-dependent methyltransferase